MGDESTTPPDGTIAQPTAEQCEHMADYHIARAMEAQRSAAEHLRQAERYRALVRRRNGDGE